MKVPQVKQTGALAPGPEKRVINVYRDGRIALDRDFVSLEELTQRLATVRQQYSGIGVVVRGDAEGAFQNVASVLGACREAGISDMGISVRLAQRTDGMSEQVIHEPARVALANNLSTAAILGNRVIGIVIWIGVAILMVALLILMRTRWGQSQPLAKCVVLSVFAHLLLFLYAHGTRMIFNGPMPPGNDTIQLAFIGHGCPAAGR